MAKSLNIPRLSQRDPQWTNQILGFNQHPSANIGTYGCLLTSLTMVVNYFGKPDTPASLNQRLKSVGGFINGGLYVFKSIEKIYPDIHESDNIWWGSFNDGVIQRNINAGNPVIAEVDINPNTTGSDMHFVVIAGYDDYGDYLIQDPNLKPGTGLVSLKRYLGTARKHYFGVGGVLKRLIVISGPATRPPENKSDDSRIRVEGERKYWVVRKGGYRSHVISEIIDAGIWKNDGSALPWKAYINLFNSLNPNSPAGGWWTVGSLALIEVGKKQEPDHTVAVEEKPIKIKEEEEAQLPSEKPDVIVETPKEDVVAPTPEEPKNEIEIIEVDENAELKDKINTELYKEAKTGSTPDEVKSKVGNNIKVLEELLKDAKETYKNISPSFLRKVWGFVKQIFKLPFKSINSFINTSKVVGFAAPAVGLGYIIPNWIDKTLNQVEVFWIIIGVIGLATIYLAEIIIRKFKK